MSRKTHIWRAKSPSIRQRNAASYFNQKMAEVALHQVQDLRALLIRIIKSEGSNLVPGRFSLILIDNEEHLPTEHDRLGIEKRDDGITVVVQDARLLDPGLKEQVEEFKKELQA